MAETADEFSQENTNDSPEVAIIVLNWNNYDDTAECLDSLEDVKYPNYRVIVVDNGSTDGSDERLKHKYGWCDFVFNESNYGFAGGINNGIRTTRKNDADYVLLLNNDTVVDPDFLQEMVTVGESDNDVGIIGSKILKYDDGTVDEAGRKLNFRDLRFNSPYEGKSESSLTGTHEVQGISGCCMMLKSELMDEIGVLDEEIFFYGGEDVDYCLRARQSGWNIVVQLDAPVHHKVSSTAGSDSPFRKYHRERNKLWLGYTHGGVVGSFGLLWRAVRNSRVAASLLLKGEKMGGKAMFRSYVDFISDIIDRRMETDRTEKRN